MEIKRALVISGGGAKGAFAGGEIEALYEKGKRWNNFYGTSTGSLLITLASIEEIQRLKESYTNVSNSDVFSIDPFTKNGKINVFNAVWRLLRKKNSLGETRNLEKHIRKMFTESDFKKSLEMEKTLCSCSTDFTSGKPVFVYNSYGTDYNTYLKFTMSSVGVPVFMEPVERNGHFYLDGGVMEHVPLQRAIEDGCDEIDCLVLRPEKFEDDNWKPSGVFSVLTRTLDLMLREISFDDIVIGKLVPTKKVTINILYTPYNLTSESLMFNKEQMKKWWKEGYEYASGNFTNIRTFTYKKNKWIC